MSGISSGQSGKPPGDPPTEFSDDGAPELDDATQAQLGRVLAKYSNELVNQPIPDIFLSLLAELEAKERGQ
ncbi:MAG TPA: NepR family anti-sigma factor [Methylocystis sp.]|nr:NepR family anti-sigma factor [Methylocystis sp.]